MSNCMSSQHFLSCVCDVSPSPSKKRMRVTCQIFTQHSSILLWEHCNSIQHCLEVLLEMGPPWFSWRLSQIELAHVCFASTCSHKRHSHHHILTRGSMHRDQSSQPLGVFLQSLTTKCQPDLQLELVTVTSAPGFFLFHIFVNCSDLLLFSTIWCAYSRSQVLQCLHCKQAAQCN